MTGPIPQRVCFHQARILSLSEGLENYFSSLFGGLLQSEMKIQHFFFVLRRVFCHENFAENACRENEAREPYKVGKEDSGWNSSSVYCEFRSIFSRSIRNLFQSFRIRLFIAKRNRYSEQNLYLYIIIMSRKELTK